ncbi:MAG: GIY-YIG nuclease family protein, partial [Spirochaetales bacterium]|nr:GIY-YIG nuclease family protein [Spirochaetales bacterium]
MKDDAGKIIYVGKASSLKKRVGSYFTGSKDVKTRVLVSNIAALETITTRNSYEALVLENNLIKQWLPRFNINLKDGKSYPVIRVTGDDYPRVFRTRRIIDDGSEYFGPYPDVHKLDAYLELIEQLFPLRKCKGPLKKREHPCLYYHIRRCPAPCAGYIDKLEYGKTVDSIRNLLSGHVEPLIRELTTSMQS